MNIITAIAYVCIGIEMLPFKYHAIRPVLEIQTLSMEDLLLLVLSVLKSLYHNF